MNIDTDSLLTTERVHQVLSRRIGHLLRARGGSAEVVDVQGEIVRIRFLGGCRSCMASNESLRAQIEDVLRKDLYHPSLVVRIHESVSEDLLDEARKILHRHRE